MENFSHRGLVQAQLSLRERPSTPHIMYQQWRSLLFLHFPCPPEEIQRLLPPGLTVDTFPDEQGVEQAWVGLVPFRMKGVRPRFLPPLPGLSAFPESNVRTYAHRDGQDPGVWFFSLDAAQGTACRLARRFFGLPYHKAVMRVEERDALRTYTSRRIGHGASHSISCEFGPSRGEAAPGTLEFFLIERYLLYAYRDGRLLTGRVHHRPYPLREAGLVSIQETLVDAAGIVSRPFVHRIASDGVDVEIYPLRA